ncbi:MAG: hypothetical protein IKM61_01150 [Eubacteriaceae bacterium]|nr:hypothetical protein [Eubacteriaceae bacterium]
MDTFEKYMNLDIDASLIGLERGSEDGGYFCTPVGAKVFGRESGIHYCFIEGYGDMVFAVNPMPWKDDYVYPLAENFRDLLKLILYAGSITVIEQIVWFSKEQFEMFIKSEDNKFVIGQAEVLDVIRKEFNISPVSDAYDYVKALQKDFDDSKIKYTDEYYDILGIPYPDGRQVECQGAEFSEVTFEINITEE